jgi:hypothetical protein
MSNCITLDRLEFVLAGDLTKTSKSNLVFCKAKPIYGYSQCHDLIIDNVKIAKISTQPKLSLRFARRDITLVQLYNDQLYSKSTESLILNAMEGYSLYSLKNIDIAIDGPHLLNKYLKLEKRFSGNRLANIKRTRDFSERTLEVSGITLGSKKSDRYVTLYNKSAEIKVSNKPYIKKYWELNGLTDLDNIDRVELRLGSKELGKTNVDLEQLFQQEYLWSLFLVKAYGMTSFKDQKNGKIKGLFSEKSIKQLNFKKLPAVHHLPFLQSDKTAVKMLFCEYVRTKNILFKEAAEEYVKARNLDDWYSNKQQLWQKAY